MIHYWVDKLKEYATPLIHRAANYLPQSRRFAVLDYGSTPLFFNEGMTQNRLS